MNTQSRNAFPVPPIAYDALQSRPASNRFTTMQQGGCAEHENARSADACGTPASTPPAAQDPASSGAKSEKRDIELWLGRYAVSVIAAVLVFLGAAYFAIALIPHLSDAAKMAVMFAASIALTAVGSVLAIRRPNGFTLALMGCGAGSLFISVLVTRLYFGMLDELAALALILAWMLMCLALIRKTQSLMLDIVLQLGLAVSVCVGFAGDFDAGKLWLLVGYQLVASAIVVGGNLMFYRKMYRSSLVLALSLSLVTTLFIWSYCAPSAFGVFASASAKADRPVGFVAAVLMVQLLSATAFAACLAQSVLAGLANTLRADKADSAQAMRAKDRRDGLDGVLSRKLACVLLVAGAILWVNAVRLDCHYAVLYCLQSIPMLDCPASVAFAVATAVMLVLVAGACVALMACGRKQGISACEMPFRPALTVLEWAGVAVALLGSINAMLFDDVFPIGFLWAWAVFVAVLGNRLGGQRFVALTLTCLVLETLIACFGLFPSFPERFGYRMSMLIGAMYAFSLCGLTGVLLYLQGWRKGNAVALALASTVFVMSYVSYCIPVPVDGWMLSVCGMVCALVWVVLGFAMRHDQLRLCGLVVVLLCVAKLVVIDLAGLDPISHTIAYIGGGMVCFVVSALYNFATHRIARPFGEGR